MLPDSTSPGDSPPVCNTKANANTSTKSRTPLIRQVLGSQDLNAEAEAGTSDFTREHQHDRTSSTSLGTSRQDTQRQGQPARPHLRLAKARRSAHKWDREFGVQQAELHPPAPPRHCWDGTQGQGEGCSESCGCSSRVPLTRLCICPPAVGRVGC